MARLAHGLGAAIILAVAVLERVRAPALASIDPDFGGYLQPAIQMLSGEGFGHTGSREFLYPAFVFAVLRAFGDLSAVVVVQHVLGIAAACLVWFAWLRIPLPSHPPWLETARRVAGLGLLATQSWLAQSIVYELQIRPEAVTPLFQGALLVAVVEGLRLRMDDHHTGRRLLAVACLCVGSATALAMLRPQTLLLAPSAVLAVGLLLLHLRPGWRLAAAALLLPPVASFALLVLPDRILAAEDPNAGRFMPGVVLSWHFHWVAPMMEEALASEPDAPGQDAVRHLLRTYAEERAHFDPERDHRYADRGFNPDRLFFGPFIRDLDEHLEGGDDAFRRLALGWFARAALDDPGRLVSKVAGELWLVYRVPDGIRFSDRAYVQGPRLQARSLELARGHAWLTDHRAGAAYVADLERAVSAASDPEGRTWTLGDARLGRRWGRVYAALNALFLPLHLAALAVLALPWRHGRPFELGWAAALAAALLLSTALTAAIAHGLRVPRYTYAMAPLGLFTAFACALLVLAWLGDRFGRGTPPQE